MIFAAVGTPARPDGSPDMTAVEAVAREIGKHLSEYRLIVEKSTVPVNTCENIRRRVALAAHRNIPFDIASNPEFLREGCAVRDFLYPDRIIVGVERERARMLLEEVYEPLTSGSYYISRHEGNVKAPPLMATDVKSAELIKHASNAFLAMKISFINAISTVCELAGADVEDVSRGMGMDSRISPFFLQAGIGYGGSCFPKDVMAFQQISKQLGYDFRLLAEVARINGEQCARFVQKVRDALWTLDGKKLAVLGLAYKPNTDDVRDSPAVQIIRRLLNEGVHVSAYDPRAMKNARMVLPQITLVSDPYEAAKGADALLLLTAWPDFRELDFGKLHALMRCPIVLDGRNFLDGELLTRLGFECYFIGRGKSKGWSKEAQT